MGVSDVVLVLGMHRSGTSAVTGVLTKLGADKPKHLMPANPQNERGFFESVPFMEFHDELLASAGTRWNDWRIFNPSWYSSPVAAQLRRQAIALFEKEFEGSALPILKDPRVCRFMPFWFDVLREMNATAHVVMPIRSPLDVAQSLKVHHGLSLTYGLLMWLRHTIDAEWQSRSSLRSIFTWREFRGDWRSVCDRIAVETKLSWPRQSDRVGHEIDQFLTKDLVHHETDDAALAVHSAVHEWTLRTYEALVQLSYNSQSNSALATLDDVRAKLDQASRLFGQLLVETEVDLDEAREQTQKIVRERDVLHARHREIAAEKTASFAEISARAGAAERSHADAVRARDALQVAHEETKAALRAREQELVERTGALAELTQRFESALADAVRERDGHVEALTAAAAERERLGASATFATTELQNLHVRLAEKETATTTLMANLAAIERDREELARRLTASFAEREEIRGINERLVLEVAAKDDGLEKIETERAELTTLLEDAVRARDALQVAHEETKAALRAREQELVERTGALAELTQRFESALADAVRERDGHVEALTAAAAERERLGASATFATTELQNLHVRLAEKETATTTLMANLAAIERDREELARRLTASFAEREEIRGINERLVLEVAAKDDGLEKIETERAELTTLLEEADAQRHDLLIRSEQTMNELHRAHENVSERANANARAMAETESAHKSQVRALRAGLIDAEAALASMEADANRKGVTRWIPTSARLRFIAKRLLESGLFDVEYYRAQLPDAFAKMAPGSRKVALAAAAHYVKIGFRIGARPNPLFDTRWYLDRNEDVLRAGVNALLHYWLDGWRDGRDPSPDFQTRYYLETNPDVRASGINPLIHYLRHGREEGRPPVPQPAHDGVEARRA
jgi:hypothetical protein